MGSVSPSRILKVKGTLIASPTDLTAASPYGGTVLGPIRDGRLFLGSTPQFVRAEEWGGQAVDLILGRDEARIAVVVRTWDSDAIEQAVPNSEAGATGDRLWLYQPGKTDSDTVRPGRGLAESYSLSICLAPRNPDKDPFIVLYNAVPNVEASHELQMSINREFDMGMVWQGLPDDSGRVLAIGRRQDITL